MANPSGETTVPVGDWTTGTLKIYLDTRLDYERQIADERDLRYQERWAAQEAATKYNQEKSNEFRGALDDLSTKQATKLELQTAVSTLTEKIDTQANLMGELRSRLDVGNPAIGTIQQQLAASDGLRKGSDITIGKIYAAIAAVGAIMGIIVLLANGLFQ